MNVLKRDATVPSEGLIALYEAGRALLAVADGQAMVSAILDLAQRTMRTSATGLARVSAQSGSLEVDLLPSESPLSEAVVRTCAQRAMQAGEVLLMDPARAGQAVDGLPPGSLLACPLKVGGTMLGALVLWREPANPPFAMFELPAGEVLAGQVAIVLERARLQSELSLKRQELEDAHRQLARTEAQANAIVATAQEAIILFDKDGVICDLNAKALEMFGRPREQVVGRNLADFAIPRRLFGVFRKHLETAYREGKDPADGCWEVIALRANGEEFPMEISTEVIETPRGKLLSTFARDITEHKRALGALQESQFKLQAIFDGVETGIFVINPETHRIVDANPVALALVGAPREQVVGAVCHKFVCPADIGSCPVTDCGQVVDNSERVLLTAKGEKRPIIKTVRPVFISGRRYLLESFVDITARKRAEKALEERTAYLYTLIETSPLGVVVLDTEERVQMSNSAFEKLFLYSRAEMQGANLEDLIIPKELADESATFTRQCLEGGSLRANTRRRRKDGTLVDVEILGVPLVMGGRPRGFLVLYQDISERKQMDEALRLTQFSMDHVSDAVYRMNPQGQIVYVNEAACRALGYSRDELLSLTIPDIDPNAPPGTWALLWEKVKTLRANTLESRHRTKTGRVFPVEVTANYLQFAGNEYAFAFARDITERKRAEAEMAERHRLATLVADVGTALTGAESLRAGLQRCAEVLVRDVGAAFARVWTVNEEEKVLELQASAGMYTHIDGGHARVPMGKFKIGRIAESGEPHLTNTVLEDSWVGDHEWARRAGMVAFAGYPLKIKDRVLGVVAAFARQLLTQATLQAFAAVADNLAQFIERKRAEEALRESEDLYRDLVENSLDLIGTHDAQGNFLSLNRAAAFVLEAPSAEALVGRPLTDYVPRNLLPEFDKYLETVLRQGHAEGMMVLATPSGKTKIVEYRNTLRRQDPLEPIVRWTGQDVTERIKAQEARAFLASLVESSQDAIIGKTLEGTIVSWNHGAEELYGYSAAEMVGKSLSILTPPNRPDELSKLLEKISRGERVSGYETVRVRKDGTRVDVSLTVSPVFDAGGKITGAATIARDITARRQAEQALWESQNQLQAILNNSSAIIYLKDAAGRFIRTNRAFENLIGLKPGQAIGKTDHNLFAKEVADNFHANDQKVLQERTPLEFEETDVHQGSIHTYLSVKFPLFDTSGAPCAVAGISTDITERKQAEQALAHERDLLHALMDNSSDYIYFKDRESRFVRINKATAQALGLNHPREAVGKTDFDFYPAENAENYFQGEKRIFQTGEPPIGQVEWVQRTDGQGGWYSATKVPIHDAQGHITGLAGISRDISEVKRAEEQARLLTTALESAANGIMIANREGRIVWVNPAFTRLSGYSAAEVVGQNPRVWKSGAHDAAFYRELWNTVLAGDVWQGEIINRRKDGTFVTEGVTITPVRDPRNTVSHFIAIKEDITGRKHAEQALRESEQRYRELFENASDIVYTTDLDGRFTSVNRVGQQTIGYSEEEATRMDLWQVVAPKHRELIKQGRARLLAGESDITSELEVTTKDGRRMTLEVKPRLIYKDGKPIGVQGIGRDITGRDVAEMELRHAQKLESVGRLASGIAHEINTPIQFVGDNTRFLQDSFASLGTLLGKYQDLRDAAATGNLHSDLLPEVRRLEEETDCAFLLEEIPRALTQTLEGVDRVATIVRAMKEFAHPESKEMAAADLNKALLSTLTVARNELKYVANVETNFGALPMVVCNVGDLNQVFLNLLVNAAHAIADVVKGTGTKGKIRVSTAAQDGAVLIAISDTGCGIPEAIRGRIYDPFFTTKEVGRGTGQGLAIARSVVVDRHKGNLTFESEVGKGTTFYIRLPVNPEGCSQETKVP